MEGPACFRSSLIALLHESARISKTAILRKETPNFKTGGHSAVTGSLTRGLEDIAVSHSMNQNLPQRSNVGTVGILAGLATLDWCAKEATRGRIKRAIVGPNLFVLPSQAQQILCEDFVSQILVPSTWVRDLYIDDLPQISEKVAVWAAGVDAEYWRPTQISRSTQKDKCLIYVKRACDLDIDSITSLCRKLGYKPIIITYGKYSRRHFRRALNQARFMIYLGESESQGLALFEAWAMGVPTFVRALQTFAPFLKENHRFLHDFNHVSAPYLNDNCGIIWTSLAALDDAISNLNDSVYKPREWILLNGTDKISARKYIKLWQSHDID